MAISPFNVAVSISLALLVGYVDLVRVEEEHATLQYIYAFFRHGIRTPLNKPYPNDPNKSEYHRYLPGPPGELTKIGKEMMYKVGLTMKSMYKGFLGDYTDENVHVSSTLISRTIMSALTVMAGMFPPPKPILDHLDWQPVPVWQDSTEFDKVYLYNDDNFPELALKECPNYGRLIEKGNNIVKNPDKMKHRQKLYELLRNYTGQPDVNSILTNYNIWDTLQFESLNGLPLPAWSTEPQTEYNNRPLYPDVMQPVMIQWFRNTEYFRKNADMLHFFSGPLLNSIYTHMVDKLWKPHSHEKMRYHSTHDDTLYAILWALGLTEPAAVEPGDGIIFELHNANNTPIVKVKYYHTIHNHRVEELTLPVCPNPCDLVQLMQNAVGLTPGQWLRKCHE